LTSSYRSRRRALLNNIRTQLAELPGDLSESAHLDEWLPSECRDALHCQRFGICRPYRVDEAAWGLEDLISTDDAFFLAYDAGLRRTPSRPGRRSGGSQVAPFRRVSFLFDPLRPESWQRNRVMRLHQIHTHSSDETCAVEDIWPQLGVAGNDQLRVLVCNGPNLLAWVGGFREGNFGAAEVTALKTLVPSLRRRLWLEQQLATARLAGPTTAALLEGIAAPAFLLRLGGSVEHANLAGRALLDGDKVGVRELLTAGVRVGCPEVFTANIGAGPGQRLLAIMRKPRPRAQERVEVAIRRWRLTGRQAEVLTGLAAGQSNKELSASLKCSERTIEVHVAAVLHKAQRPSRAALVAALLEDDV
jgi:DNA-binding CsgD family transcriptional regulator